jgi:ABC-type glycerol-3-phosphate transport system permease component
VTGWLGKDTSARPARCGSGRDAHCAAVADVQRLNRVRAADHPADLDVVWGIIIIGALVSVIPLIIAFLALQKYWQGGLSLGALK